MAKPTKVTKVTKVTIDMPHPDPLDMLLNICGSIKPPSKQALKSMLKNYKVVNEELWYSIFIEKWPNFYTLPALLDKVIKTDNNENRDFSNLCYQMLDDINNCQESIENALDAKPDGTETTPIQIESFYDLMTNKFHMRLTRICTQLNNYYLPEFLKALHSKNINESLAKPTVKPTKPLLLTEKQLEIWNLLDKRILMAKELASKSDSTDGNVRKIIEKIRKHKGKGSILRRSSRGYWRPDAPPSDYTDVTPV